MEDFSQFIHEEIFLLQKESVKPAERQIQHALGVIANLEDSEDEKLFNAILGAIKLERSSVSITNIPDNSAKIWLSFSSTNESDYFQTEETDFGSVIMVPMLSELRTSKELKGELWKILKTHFDI